MSFFGKLWNAPIGKICIENPVPSKIFKLPLKTQTIQPYFFGEAFKKRTCLWLKNLPVLRRTDVADNPEKTRKIGNWFNKGGYDRQKNRAKTFQGIADAMATQWTSEDIIVQGNLF